ncbi:MAG: hypothetical protein RDU76_05445 [Candidatus Edwardsbacteria bacterium]|nr:hypothetical protein [Candidatus Edwardsbacteria bacterium]
MRRADVRCSSSKKAPSGKLRVSQHRVAGCVHERISDTSCPVKLSLKL